MDKDVKIRIYAKDDASKAFDDVEKSNKALAASLLKTSAAFTALAAVGVAAMYNLLEASAAQEKVVIQLKNSLDAVGESYEKNGESVLKFANRIQQMTGVADERSIPAIARLTEAFGSSKVAMDVFAGLLAKSKERGEDFTTAIKAAEMATRGSASSLERYGFEMEGVSTKSEIANAIIEQSRTALQTMAEQSDLASVKFDAMFANIADWKEPIGDVLEKTLAPLAEELRRITEDIKSYLDSGGGELAANLLMVGTALSGILASVTAIGAGLLSIGFALPLITKGIAHMGAVVRGLNAVMLSPAGIIATLGLMSVSMALFPKETKKGLDLAESYILEFIDSISIDMYDRIIKSIGKIINSIALSGDKLFSKLLDMALNISRNIGIGIRNILYFSMKSVLDEFNSLIDKINTRLPTALKISKFDVSGLGAMEYPKTKPTTPIILDTNNDKSDKTTQDKKAQGFDPTKPGEYQKGFAKTTTKAQTPFEKYNIELLEGGKTEFERLGIDFTDGGFGIESTTGFGGSVTPDYGYYSGDQAGLDQAEAKFRKELGLPAIDTSGGGSVTIINNNNIQGSLLSENSLAEMIKNILKGSGQSGDAYNF